MSRAGSQQRTLLEILGKLRPFWRNDTGLASRIDTLLSRDRRLGSRDRRLYRELIYVALRYLPWVEPLLDSEPAEAARRIAWLSADSPSVGPFRQELAGDLPDCPPDSEGKARILGEEAAALSPGWLGTECPEALAPPLRDALLSRAPLWLRLQTADPAPVLAEFDGLSWAWSRNPRAPGALKLGAGLDVAKTEAYLTGKVEIQDIGSQLILETVGVATGGHWLDACAGSGGKTLQLAALLGPEGVVTARDIRRAALQELSVRATRAGLQSRIRVGAGEDPPRGFDGVLVDAPCSGSGTWRRSPHLRWATTAASLLEGAGLQLQILAENASRVRPGGTLVYATCSLCRTENESVVERFLGGARGFEPLIRGTRIAPPEPDGDAFFVASFIRRS